MSQDDRVTFAAQVGYSSLPELVPICLLPIFLLMLRDNIIHHWNLRSDHHHVLTGLPAEFVLIYVPQILLLTMLSDYVLQLALPFMLFVFCWSVFRVGTDCARFADKAVLKTHCSNSNSYGGSTTTLITSCIMIFTIDLPICPRRFAKTHSFGLGLMDVGTGMFIVATATNAAQFMVYQRPPRSFAHLFFRTVCPCVTLGLSRAFVTWVFGYAIDSSEYGIHWNFFLTFGVVRCLSALLTASVSSFWGTSLSIRLGCLSALALIFTGLSGWVNEHVRYTLSTNPSWPDMTMRNQSLWFANLEGFTSLFGYCAIYVFSLIMITIKHHFCNRRHPPRTVDLASYSIRLSVSYCFISLIFLCCFYHSGGIPETSRRFANPAYVCFILFIGSVGLFVHELHGIIRCCFDQCAANRGEGGSFPLSQLYSTMNRWGLTYFMVCNILTGCFNLLFNPRSLLPPGIVPDSRTGRLPIPVWSTVVQLTILWSYCALGVTLTSIIARRRTDTSRSRDLKVPDAASKME